MKGTLFVVSLPIGNLKDITLRALETLKEADLILSEKPKTLLKLLNFYQIKKPVFKIFEHQNEKKFEKIFKFLEEGKKLVFVSEAGTPAISDPGAKLVSLVRARFGEKVKIVPVPGPSALTCLFSVAGVPSSKFLFFGFLPKKKKRKKVLQEVAQSQYPVIFFESPHRILKTLKELEKENSELEVVVGRELTKMFEEIFVGKISQAREKFEKGKTKGEFTVLVWQKRK